MAEQSQSEREFLHDLATPLGTAMFLLDSVLEGLQLKPDSDPETLKQLSQAFEALEKMKALLQSRRTSIG